MAQASLDQLVDAPQLPAVLAMPVEIVVPGGSLVLTDGLINMTIGTARLQQAVLIEGTSGHGSTSLDIRRDHGLHERNRAKNLHLATHCIFF